MRCTVLRVQRRITQSLTYAFGIEILYRMMYQPISAFPPQRNDCQTSSMAAAARRISDTQVQNLQLKSKPLSPALQTASSLCSDGPGLRFHTLSSRLVGDLYTPVGFSRRRGQPIRSSLNRIRMDPRNIGTKHPRYHDQFTRVYIRDTVARVRPVQYPQLLHPENRAIVYRRAAPILKAFWKRFATWRCSHGVWLASMAHWNGIREGRRRASPCQQKEYGSGIRCHVRGGFNRGTWR